MSERLSLSEALDIVRGLYAELREENKRLSLGQLQTEPIGFCAWHPKSGWYYESDPKRLVVGLSEMAARDLIVRRYEWEYRELHEMKKRPSRKQVWADLESKGWKIVPVALNIVGPPPKSE